MSRSKKSIDQAMADLAWWESHLPPGWQVHGWSYRSSASVFLPNNQNRILQIDLELMEALGWKSKVLVPCGDNE